MPLGSLSAIIERRAPASGLRSITADSKCNPSFVQSIERSLEWVTPFRRAEVAKRLNLDPVQANHRSNLICRQTLEDAAASLDDSRGTKIVLVAHDQQRINTLMMRKIDGPTKHLCGIALASKTGQHAIADMPALAGKPIVQREAYRHAADEFAVHLAGEEFGTDSIRWEIRSRTVTLNVGKPIQPGHVRLIAQEKNQALRREFHMCGQCHLFIS